MKLLFFTIIVLVIPIFFVLVFAMSTFHKLTSLRDRCRETRRRIDAAAAGRSATATSSLSGTVPDLQAQRDFDFAMEHYHAARRKFPVSLLAALCGFHEMEPLPDPPGDGRREGP